MLKPINSVFKLLKYVLAFENAINSVVHTGVKHESLGVVSSGDNLSPLDYFFEMSSITRYLKTVFLVSLCFI